MGNWHSVTPHMLFSTYPQFIKQPLVTLVSLLRKGPMFCFKKRMQLLWSSY